MTKFQQMEDIAVVNKESAYAIGEMLANGHRCLNPIDMEQKDHSTIETKIHKKISDINTHPKIQVALKCTTC